MNIKLRFQVGLGPLISPVRQGPCGLNPALITLDVIVHYLGHFVHIECPFWWPHNSVKAMKVCIALVVCG